MNGKILTESHLPALQGKRCINCGKMRPQKNNDYCYRCDPERKDLEYHFPSFEKLSTVSGIKRAYGNLLNALRKKRIKREDATAMFYGLNSFIRAMKDIIDMKLELEKEGSKSIITEAKIDQLKELVNRFDKLNEKFSTSKEPMPSGEIAQEKGNIDTIT